MLSNTLQAFAFLASGYFLYGTSANSGYAGSCNGLELVPPQGPILCYEILANCAQESGVYNVNEWMSLSTCFGNQGGTLVPEFRGSFGLTCQDVSLSGTILTASCGDGHGGYKTTSIDTNDYIGNNDGVMYCFNTNDSGSSLCHS